MSAKVLSGQVKQWVRGAGAVLSLALVLVLGNAITPVVGQGTISGPPLHDIQHIHAGIHRPALSQTAASNTTAIQSAITAAGAYFVANGRPGEVWIDSVGVFPVGVQGTNPYENGTQYCFSVPSGVTIHIATGCTLRLPNNTQTDGGGSVNMFVFRDVTDLVFTGGGTLDLNSLNQSGWTGGYSQNGGGHFHGYCSTSTGSSHIYRVTIEKLNLLNTFGNPCNIGRIANDGSPTCADIHYRDLVCVTFGEGIQFIGVDGCGMVNCREFDPNKKAVGDWFEFANCKHGHCVDCLAGGNAGNTTGGGAIDFQGSQYISVVRLTACGTNYISESNSFSGIVASNNTITDSNFSNIRDAIYQGDGLMTWTNCRFCQCGLLGTASVQMLSTVSTSRLRLTDCTFSDCGYWILKGAGTLETRRCNFDNPRLTIGLSIERDDAGNLPTWRSWHTSINAEAGASRMAVRTYSASTNFAPTASIYGGDFRGGFTDGSFQGVEAGLLSNFTYAADVLYDANPPPIAAVATWSKSSTNSNGFTTDAVNTTGATDLEVVVSYLVSVPTLTDSKSNTWIQGTPSSSGNGNANVVTFRCNSPVVGTNHTLTLTGDGTYPALAGVALSNVHNSPLDQTNAGANNLATSLATGSITPTVNRCGIIAGLGWNETSGVDPAVNAGMTVIALAEPVSGQSVGAALAFKAQSGTAAAINPTFTISSGSAMATNIRSVKPAQRGTRRRRRLREVKERSTWLCA